MWYLGCVISRRPKKYAHFSLNCAQRFFFVAHSAQVESKRKFAVFMTIRPWQLQILISAIRVALFLRHATEWKMANFVRVVVSEMVNCVCILCGKQSELMVEKSLILITLIIQIKSNAWHFVT